MFRKTIATVSFALALALGASAQTPSIAWFTANMTADTFYISNANELAGLSQIVNGTAAGGASSNFIGKVVVLTGNVDLTAYASGGGWVPIGAFGAANSFNGVFDGRGKVVSNLYAGGGSGTFIGLFGQIGASELFRETAMVKNLGVTGASVTGGADNVAGVLAGLVHGRVINCYTEGSVTAVRGGGLVGQLNGRIENSYSSASVSVVQGQTGADLGGLVGILSGVAANSYASGSVSGAGNTGGLAGSVRDGALLQDCAALNPSVINAGTGSAGRLAGSVVAGVQIDNCAVLASMTGTIGNGTTAAVGEITILTVYQDSSIGGRFTTANGWTLETRKLPGLFGSAASRPDHLTPRLNSVGSGSSESPYRIFTVEQLTELAERTNAGDTSYSSASKFYAVAASIDLNTAPYNTGRGWTPIGTAQHPFKGTFRGGGGAGNKITGLFINDNTLDYAGLFGMAEGASFVNIMLENVNVTGKNYVGGLLGHGYAAIMICHVTGTVRGNDNTGGVVGMFPGSTAQSGDLVLDASSFNGVVTGNDYVGGLVGMFDNDRARYITQNCALGTVSGRDNVGGLFGAFASAYPLMTSFFAGDVSGTNNVGGIVGNALEADIDNCYTIGTVTGTGHSVGGIAGTLGEGGSIAKSAAINESVNFPDPEFGGRVVGEFLRGSTFNNNVAFSGMKNAAGDTVWAAAPGRNGADITADRIKTGGTMGGLFTDGWTNVNGKLPYFVWQTVDLPVYLGGQIAVAESAREVPASATQTSAAVAPAVIAPNMFTAGPNVASRLTGSVSFFWTGSAVRGGDLTVYGASGGIVRKINIADGAGAGRRAVGAWNLKDARGRPVADGTYLVRGSLNTADGRHVRVSTMVGVR